MKYLNVQIGLIIGQVLAHFLLDLTLDISIRHLFMASTGYWLGVFNTKNVIKNDNHDTT